MMKLPASDVKFLQHCRAGRVRRVQRRLAPLNPLSHPHGVEITHTRNSRRWDWAVKRGLCLARRLEAAPNLVEGRVWVLELTEQGAQALDGTTGRRVAITGDRAR